MSVARRSTWIALGASLIVVTVLMAGLVAVTQRVLHHRRNSVELCDRRFRRTGDLSTATEVRALGDLHLVGASVAGDELWTVTTAWPERQCDGPTPTLLFSRAGDDWRVWTLVGGP